MHCFELIQSAGCFPLPWGGWWSWVSALSRLCPSCFPVFLSCCFASTLKPYCSQACGFHGTLHPSQQNHSIKEWLGSSSEGSRLFNEGIYNGGLYLGNVFFLWFASEYDETWYPILLHRKSNLGASCESWSFCIEKPTSMPVVNLDPSARSKKVIIVPMGWWAGLTKYGQSWETFRWLAYNWNFFIYSRM